MEYKLEKDIESIIRYVYKTDDLLLEKYHIVSGTGYDNCCNNTIDVLKENKVNVYKILDNNKCVGYFGKEDDKFLTGFFIIPEYRKYKNIIWNLIKKEFNCDFMTFIYNKNKPAINFFSKRAKKFISNEDLTGFIFKGE